MHHSYLDKYARHDSALHRLDARTKVMLFISLVILIAIVPQPGWLFIAVIMSLVIIGTCFGIPLFYLLIRSAVVIPFTGFAILSYMLTKTQGDVYWQWGSFALTSEGLSFGLRLLIRAWIAVCLMILLVNTTPFDRILAALRAFRIPSIFVMLLSFLYRYLYLLWDEVEHMQRARNVRYFGGRLKPQGRWLGSMATSLFIRSYDRAERVQKAMEARGWTGEAPSAKLKPLSMKDLIIIVLGFSGIIALWLIRNL